MPKEVVGSHTYTNTSFNAHVCVIVIFVFAIFCIELDIVLCVYSELILMDCIVYSACKHS